MTTSRKKYTEQLSRQTRKSRPLLERASAQIQRLSRLVPDRQPDAEKQSAETEWRRQRDLVSSISLLRDVVVDVIKDLERFGLDEEDVEKLIRLEEEIEENPCRNPKDLIEWLKCWQKWWIYLRECCEEHRGYWRQFFYTFHWVGNRLDELQHYAQEKFDEISDQVDGDTPPDSTWLGTPQTYERVATVQPGETAITYKSARYFMQVETEISGQTTYYYQDDEPVGATTGSLWLTRTN